MKASICMASYDREPEVIEQVMGSIFSQKVPFDFEVILCDDGSPKESTRNVCEQHGVRYYRINREPGRRNPCVARNIAYKAATGDVIIAQSDEVVHISPRSVETLVSELEQAQTSFIIANVLACSPDGEPWSVYTGEWVTPGGRRLSRSVPYFFLGALWRSDLYAIGGNDEDFVKTPGYDDEWFAECLMKGLGLTPRYATSVVGHHLYHPPRITKVHAKKNQALGHRKRRRCQRTGVWCSPGGPWECSSPAPSTIERKFTQVYLNKEWGDKESLSGHGSSTAATQAVRNGLPAILEVYGIQSMLDIPCGDFYWMQHVDLGSVEYLGADIVQPLIQANRETYERDRTKFCCLDLLTSDLPEVGLVFCRDCLGHLSLEDAKKALSNIARSQSKYILTTTFFRHPANRDINTGAGWTTRCLTSPPFNLPSPRLILDEMCVESYPNFRDKSVALWPTSDLLSAL